MRHLRFIIIGTALLASPSYADTTPDYLKTLLQREQTLKAAIPSGGEAAIFKLIEFYLEQPQQGEYNVYPAQGKYRDLFAAHCWHQQLSGTEEAIAANPDGYAKLKDLVRKERHDDFAMMPRRPDGLYENIEAIRAQQAERWGESVYDQMQLANKHIQVTMPALAGIELRNEEDLANARSVAQQLLEANPDRPEPWAYLAQLYQMTGDEVASRQHAEQALQRYPNYYLAQLVISNIEMVQYRRDHACDLEVVWQRLIQTDETNNKSILMMQALVAFYQAAPTRHRLEQFHQLVDKRHTLEAGFYDPVVREILLSSGGRPNLNQQQFLTLRQLLMQLKQEKQKLQ